MIIHKLQELTLPRTVSDSGPSESIAYLDYMGFSSVRKLSNLMVESRSFESLKSIRQSANFPYRI